MTWTLAEIALLAVLIVVFDAVLKFAYHRVKRWWKR